MVLIYLAIVCIASLVIAAEAQGDEACRSNYPGYVISEGHEALNQGCYHTSPDNSVLPREPLVSLRSEIDWVLWTKQGNAKDMIQKCGALAIQRGVSYFGVEFYGECYFGNDPDFCQPKVTQADDCSNLCYLGDVGGSSAMVLYKVENWAPRCAPIQVGYTIDASHWAWTRGCYRQQGNQLVFPKDSFVDMNSKLGSYELRADGHAGVLTRECGLIALQNGASFFGVDEYYTCYYGSSPDLGGGEPFCEHAKCLYDVGVGGYFMLYKIMDV